jgi:hypothetical protein
MLTTGYKRFTEGGHEAFCFGAFCFGAFALGFCLKLLLLAFGLLDFWCGRLVEGKRITEGKRNAKGVLLKGNC